MTVSFYILPHTHTPTHTYTYTHTRTRARHVLLSNPSERSAKKIAKLRTEREAVKRQLEQLQAQVDHQSKAIAELTALDAGEDDRTRRPRFPISKEQGGKLREMILYRFCIEVLC